MGNAATSMARPYQPHDVDAPFVWKHQSKLDARGLAACGWLNLFHQVRHFPERCIHPGVRYELALGLIPAFLVILQAMVPTQPREETQQERARLHAEALT